MTGWCPACGFQVPLREDGTLRTHYPLGGAVACAGRRPDLVDPVTPKEHACTSLPDIKEFQLMAGTQWECPTCGTLWVVWPGPSIRNRALEWGRVERLHD